MSVSRTNANGPVDLYKDAVGIRASRPGGGLCRRRPDELKRQAQRVNSSGHWYKVLVTSLILTGLTLPVFAQTPSDLPTNRDASFLTDEAPLSSSELAFSGLAAPPPELAPPPAIEESKAAAPAQQVQPETPQAAAPSPPLSAPPAATTAPQAAPSPATPAAPSQPQPVLSDTGGESIGMQAQEGLGAALWKGTPRPVAERLLSLATLTGSPLLNDLTRRLLMTPATPPEGDSEAAQSLTAMRVEKLVTFGDTDAAWDLAAQADPKLIDDITLHFAAEAELANGGDSICANLPAIVKTRGSVDWRKPQLICALRAGDAKTAQDIVASLSADQNRDDILIEIANKNILSEGKALPNQLTPLTAPLLALLKLTNMPLPGELYGHPDFALTPALLRAPAKQDVARLGLAERAAARGVISSAALETVYRGVVFTAAELATPLTSTASGSRLRALLFQAAANAKQPSDHIALAVKFLQSAPPALLNGAPQTAADMLGTIKADPTQSTGAADVAQIYMLAGRGDLALDWLRLARRTQEDAADPAAKNNAAELQSLWPQFTLAGLEAEGDYAADLTAWLDAALKPADSQADIHAAHDNATASLLLLDACGFKIPDSAWVKLLAAAHNEKHIALPPLLFARLQEAGAGGRRGETILLAVALAGDGDIPLPAAVTTARALRDAGLKSDAAIFARQIVALQPKPN